MNSDQTIIFELLAHQELKKFQEFIRNNWSKDHLFVNEESVFDWQHKGARAYHCLVAKRNGNLVGVHCVIPLSQFDKLLPTDQIFLALWSASEKKGIGIGLRLFQNTLKEYKPKFVCSIGINPRLVSFHKRQGFTVGIMDHHVILSPYVKEFKVAKVPDNLKFQSQKIKSTISYNKISKEEFNDLNTKELYLYQRPLKSDTYMINRYMNHPIYNYDIYKILKDNKLKALCVIRPIINKNVRVLRFVDFVGSNNVFLLLNDFVLSLLKKTNAEYLDIYSHGIPSVLFEKSGFINRHKNKGLIIPNHFEPFTGNNMDLIFGYKNSFFHPPVRIFRADDDQDRPNQITRENECWTV